MEQVTIALSPAMALKLEEEWCSANLGFSTPGLITPEAVAAFILGRALANRKVGWAEFAAAYAAEVAAEK